ncbi:AAA family ATPase [Burkholderia guangdongensis]|uniref:AAA family ATPase n=1 Tax=Burkholderia guangdongensis TaxID=1792500 RepID=UPI0015C6FB10|nr:AAA family ATPase [Burkholderia guangdongensis]
MGAFDLSGHHSRVRAGAASAERLIAVVSDAGSEEAIRNLVFDQGVERAHVERGTIDDAIELMATLEHSPRHLIVDLSGSSMPVSDMMRLADVCDPSVAVIVVGEHNDVGLYRNLLRIGVREYLVKPLTVELVQRALEATDAGAATRVGKAIGFVGARGGVGVTTIATALARHMADQTRRRVVYVDLDLHGGGACTMLGVTSGNGLVELLQNTQRLDEQLINQAIVAQSDRLFVLSSEAPFDSPFAPRTGAVAELIGVLKSQFHYVVLDLPERAGRIVDEALDACGSIHVVADRSVHGAREAARLCRFAEGRAADPTVTLLINNALPPARGRADPADIAQALARASVHEFPHEPHALALAENLGEPIADSHRSGFAQAIVGLAHALTGGDANALARARRPWYARFSAKLGRA